MIGARGKDFRSDFDRSKQQLFSRTQTIKISIFVEPGKTEQMSLVILYFLQLFRSLRIDFFLSQSDVRQP